MTTLLTDCQMRKLCRYTEPAVVVDAERRFRALTAVVLAVCAAAGTLLSLVEVTDTASPSGTGIHRVTVELETVSLDRAQTPRSVPESAPPEPPHLDPATVLSQAVDRESIQPTATPAPIAAPAPTAPAPRRVYGVRKVYARGLGSGGVADPGLVVKQGNTVDGRPDTLTASAADLQGELAGLSTVDQAPEPIHRAKPNYSPALIAAQARGTVTAYLLVDVDGSVQDVTITEDIGHDSRDVATAAFRRFRFRPALRDGEPVAVWILHRIRFEFQG